MKTTPMLTQQPSCHAEPRNVAAVGWARRTDGRPVRHGLAPGMSPPRAKVAADFVLSLLLFLAALPLLALLTLLIRLTSRGPALYSQVRVGRGGRLYRIFKLRTMYHECEKLSGPRWSAAGDPRVTPLGRFLRKTHLDELPQLWNVLRGEMSLVGPRPERPEFIPALEEAIPHYRERLQVRPGVTGLAQIQLPPDTDLDSVRRKLRYDLYYVRHLSPWLDLKILLSTGLKVLHVPFCVARVLFRVPGADRVEAVGDGVGREVVTLAPELA
jgi:lipopolysaccharide/colanic/teichoic acid biosynthesis glycosyltransferase